MKLKISSLIFATLFASPLFLQAATIGDLMETDWREQLVTFWSMESSIVRNAVIGSLLIGILCGLLGSFLVTRRMALFGDMLAHAILPGVALGFLWNQTKDPIAIFVGASVVGLLGAGLTQAIKATTRLKEDGVLGIVLAGFYGVGILLISIIQNQGYGNQSGIDKYMFGQASALSSTDIKLLAIITVLSLLFVIIFYKELLSTSFDFQFSYTTGIPTGFIQYSLMLMLSFAVVVSLQATGVVIAAAMLILPAASAYLLTDRLHILLLLACLLGAFSGFSGAFISYLQSGLPTGPFMVLSAAGIFVGAFLLSPRHGVIALAFRKFQVNSKIRLENALKGAYLTAESNHNLKASITISQFANERNIDRGQALREINLLSRKGFVEVKSVEHTQPESLLFALTPRGQTRGAELVKAHRLWELYLTEAASFDVGSVHPDAERIEHVLGADTIRALEQRLQNPSHDPHGRLIPTSNGQQEETT